MADVSVKSNLTANSEDTPNQPVGEFKSFNSLFVQNMPEIKLDYKKNDMETSGTSENTVVEIIKPKIASQEKISEIVNSIVSKICGKNLDVNNNGDEFLGEDKFILPENVGNIPKKNMITLNTAEKKTGLKYPRAANQKMPLEDRVASEPRDVRISKGLAAVLRHGKMGIQLDCEGYAFIEHFLKHSFFINLNVTIDDIIRVTNYPIDSIQRFAICSNSNKKMKIRALDGHTVNVKNLDLIPITIQDTMHMPFAIHGTYWKAWEKIKNNGLKKINKKTHLYFQPGDLSIGLSNLVKRFRNNCEVLVYIDIAKAINGGIQFYKSINNVVMTTGDRLGRIPARYFLKAVHISPTTGEQIWIESLGNDSINTQALIQGLENDRATRKSNHSRISFSNGSSPDKPKHKIPKGPNPHPVLTIQDRDRKISCNSVVLNRRSRNSSLNSSSFGSLSSVNGRQRNSFSGCRKSIGLTRTKSSLEKLDYEKENAVKLLNISKRSYSKSVSGKIVQKSNTLNDISSKN